MNQQHDLAHDAPQVNRTELQIFFLDQRAHAPDDFAGSVVILDDVVENFTNFFDIYCFIGQEALGGLRVAQDSRKRLIQLVRERSRQLSHGRDAHHMRELIAVAPQFGFGALALGHVQYDPHPALVAIVEIHNHSSLRQHPSLRAFTRNDAKLPLKWHAGYFGVLDLQEHARPVLGVYTV